MGKRSAESRRKALEAFFERTGTKPGPIAKAAGIPPTTLYGFLQGKSDDMGAGVYEALATAANVSVDVLLGHSDESRDRILAAGERLINERGYDHVTVAMICEIADVRPSVFLAHFSDIRDMLYAIVERYNERSFSDVTRLLPAYGTATDRICYVFRRYFDVDLAHRRLTAVLHAYSWEWPADLQRKNRQQIAEHHDLIVSILDAAADGKEISQASFRTLSDVLLSVYYATLRRALFDNLTAEQAEAAMKAQITAILAVYRRAK